MVSKVISGNDILEKCHEKETEHYIDMSDFYADDYREIISHLKPLHIGGLDITVMDLFNLPLATEDGIKDFIKKRLRIDIDTNHGLEQINNLFEKAINLYETRYLKNLPTKFKKLKFQNSKSVIKFLLDTKNSKITGSINCAIAKVSYAIDDVLSNEKVRRAEFLDRQFISEHLERPFQIQEGYEDKNGNIYRIGTVVIDGKIINFKLIARQKGTESIIGKQLADAKYYSVDQFRDLVGVTIYVDEDWQAAFIMQYIDQMIYKGKSQIKNKNGLDLIAVKGKVYLNEEFYLKLEKETKINENEETEDEKEYNERKKSTSKKYKEIKLIGNVELSLEQGTKSSKYPIGTEIKFVVGGHDNEEGISLQSIYDYAKRFRELTRLGIPIRTIDIINYVNDFFENIDEILKKKNKDKNIYFKELFEDLLALGCIGGEEKLNGNIQLNEKILAIGLYKYFEGKLIKIKFPHSKKIYYFDENMIKMRNAGLYKKFEVI